MEEGEGGGNMVWTHVGGCVKILSAKKGGPAPQISIYVELGTPSSLVLKILVVPSSAPPRQDFCSSIWWTKRTRKVGVTGKYGTRYGASLRKQVKKMEITQHARYTCTFCGKVSERSNDSVKRTAVGIWHCHSCKKTIAGVHGQYRRLRPLLYGGESFPFTLLSVESDYLPSTVRRLRELTEA
ncbi:ribosomal L37ae protein family-domain-containing protein [Suillus spraguei]|nr:ribosomal L37ae protein family-domain-containing protein [Suillus spraguei]